MYGNGLPPDDIIGSDQWPERRRRRQKNSSKLIEEKAEAYFSSGKENIGASILEGSSHDNTREDGKFSSGNAWVKLLPSVDKFFKQLNSYFYTIRSMCLKHSNCLEVLFDSLNQCH